MNHYSHLFNKQKFTFCKKKTFMQHIKKLVKMESNGNSAYKVMENEPTDNASDRAEVE